MRVPRPRARDKATNVAPGVPGSAVPYRRNSTITPATATTVPVSVRQVMRSP